MDRRQFCFRGLALPALGLWAPSILWTGDAGAQDATTFNRDWVVRRAESLAAEPFKRPTSQFPAAVDDLKWDGYQEIRYRPDQALWHDADVNFQVQFFHLGLYYKEPVEIFEVIDGEARPVPFSPALFDYGRSGVDPDALDGLGFAGFRLHHFTDFERDLVVFLGASYFRAVGADKQFGLSARGLAIDTGLPDGEEFPIFRSFWLERPAPGQSSLTIHALLDSKSVTGAYTFVVEPGRTTNMNVTAKLFPRTDIRQLGIAPLTSMYLIGENDRRVDNDFRPEIHDSDGLSMHRGNGEWLWRPLTNPADLAVSSFVDENPRGFGLRQRDRRFENYQDDGVFYDRRPDLWIEPTSDWGRGAVKLVEIPTDQEIFDNIVAFWTPEQPVAAGQPFELSYRLYWGKRTPADRAKPAKVVATRIGAGGHPGQKRPENTHKFVIDFAGGHLDLVPTDAKVEPVITTSRGEISIPAARPIEELGGVARQLRPSLGWRRAG